MKIAILHEYEKFIDSILFVLFVSFVDKAEHRLHSTTDYTKKIRR